MPQRRQGGLRSGVAAGLVAAGAAAPAVAAEWTRTLFFSQRLDTDTNFAFEDDAQGEPEVQSRTNLGITFAGVSSRTRVRFSPGFSYAASTADGAEFDGFNDVNPRFRGSIGHQATQRTSLSASASVIPRETNTLAATDEDEIIDDGDLPVIDDDGIEFVRTNAIQIASNVSASASTTLDQRTSSSLFLNFSRRDFTEDVEELATTMSYGGGFSLSRRLDGLTSASGTLRYNRFETIEAEGSDTDTLSASIGLSRRFSNDLSLSVDGGLTYFETERTSRAGDVILTDTDSSTTLTGGFDVNYGGFDTRDFNVGLGLSQGLVQDSDGEISNRTSARLSVRQRVNSVSSLGASARFSLDNPVGTSEAEPSQSLSISTFYTYRFAEAWNLRLGYSFRARADDDEDAAVSNRVFLQLSRNFSLD